MTRRLVGLCVFVALALPCAAQTAQTGEAKKAVDASKALQRKIRKPNINTGFKKSLDKLSKLAGVRITADWPAIEAAGVKPTRKVAIKAPQATVEQLLDLILAQVAEGGKPLAWWIEPSVIHVSTQLRAVRGRRPTVRATVPARQRGTPRPAAPKPQPPKSKGVQFNQTPLSDVIEFLRAQSGLNFHVNWRSLETAGIDRSTEVTLKASGIGLGRLLDLITDDISGVRDKFGRVWWTIDEGIVKIATGSAMDTDLRVRMFDVSDILMTVPNFQGVDLRLADQSSSSSSATSGGIGARVFDNQRTESRDDESSQQREQREENLIQIIKNAIGQDMWQPIGKGSVKIVRGRLIISQTLLGFTLLQRSGML